MNMKKYFLSLLLLIILSGGLVLRLYKLGSNPAGFFCDEAAIGYNAYRILTTGRDEWKQPFPFFFRSFGAYRNPFPIYFTIPSVAVFGLNELAVRFASATAGFLTIIFLFLLSKHLFSKETALFAALFLAISPWHVHFSRFGSEYIYLPFLFTLGFYLFLLGLKRKTYLPLAFFIFGVSLYTYYPAWLIVPFFVTGLIFFYRKLLLKTKKFFLLGVFIFLISIFPLLVGIKKGVALSRWNQVSALKTFQAQKINLSKSAKIMINTYFSHFSYDFLFKKGDIDYPGHFIRRFSVKGMGELYLFQLPLVILGILSLVLNLKKVSSKIIFLWLALYPLGSTLIGTDGGGPFAFRSIFGVIPFQIVSAIGVTTATFFLKKIHKSLYIIFMFLFIFVSTLALRNYIFRYFVEYPLYSSDFWGWQYGPREVMKYFLEVRNNYDELLLMGNFNAPEIFIKFYDPENLCQGRCQIGGLERLDFNKRQLFAIDVDRLSEIPKYLEFGVIKKVDYPNQTPAFYIGEMKRFQRVSIP